MQQRHHSQPHVCPTKAFAAYFAALAGAACWLRRGRRACRRPRPAATPQGCGCVSRPAPACCRPPDPLTLVRSHATGVCMQLTKAEALLNIAV
jgi:hypothetical protein